MSAPRVCVLRAPGTNCDVETAFAFDACGARAERVHLFRLLENPAALNSYQILCIPGGFSYGDDIGAGVIFSSQLRVHLAEAVGEFLQSDRLVLGICNGFQVLLKAGILPGGKENWPPQDAESRPATLTWNDNGKYTARWVRLKVVARQNVFLNGIDEIDLPIAHAEGRLVVREEALLDQWREEGRVALCYCSRACHQDGERGEQSEGERGRAGEGEMLAAVGSPRSALGSQPSTFNLQPSTLNSQLATGESAGVSDWKTRLPYPDNPNGSAANIAGLSDSSGRVLGLMPHPERFIHATQHPQWTRTGLTGEGAGFKVFRNAVEYFG